MTSFRFIVLGFVISTMAMVLARPCAAATPYQPGEVIRYNIKQIGMKVGEASLTFAGERDVDGKKAVLIIFTSRGPAFFDNEEIYVDPKTFRPIRVLRDLKIFGGHERISEDYQPDGRVRIRKNAGGKVTETVLEKKGPVDNIYGFIYRYRAEGDFSMKKSFEVRLPTVDVVMKITEEGNFNAGGKAYQAAVMRSVPAKYTIWMDKGEKRLPLRITGAVGIANTVMTMVGTEQEIVKSEVRGQKSDEEKSAGLPVKQQARPSLCLLLTSDL